VPLSRLQSEILLLLAENRDPESYVAGSTYLLRNRSRISGDIDIFHDREERVAHAAEQDVAALQNAGVEVRWQRFSQRCAMTCSAMYCIRSTLPPTR
jgi:hypothetical protein